MTARHEGETEPEELTGRTEGHTDDPMDVWDIFEEATWDTSKKDNNLRDRFPADVEVIIRVR